jgi:hypothetical protein
MRFAFKLEENWPPNAWLAVCEPGAGRVEIRHGDRVETADDWFCEAVWGGPYEAGDLDQTDVIFGSGGRIRTGAAIFVSSGSTVDRLQFSHSGGKWYVSNSLVCLVAILDIDLDPCYAGYYRDFRSIVDGINKVKRTVRTLSGALELCYFQDLVWDGDAVVCRDKPLIDRDFSTFTRYTEFLRASLRELVANGQSSARKYRYATLGTLSTGYDSAAVAVLATAAGNKEVITFDSARWGAEDNGQNIASRLGLGCRIFDREAWQALAFSEIPFLAADAYGEEMHYAGTAEALTGRMFLTGFQGGKVWRKEDENLGPDLVRRDPSGLALTEYRLWRGFVHCPVPFLGARQIRAINAISNAECMQPWDVGGDYSKPICRRILEEAGVPRDWFGQRKRAASIVLLNVNEPFLSEQAREDYRLWLDRLSWAFVHRGQLPPLLLDRIHPRRMLRAGVNRLPAGAAAAVRDRIPGMRPLLARGAPLFYFLLPWAMSRAVASYRR